jgi:hypothetical protein
MKITITPTTKVVQVRQPGGGEVEARIWEGAFEGAMVHLFVVRVAVPLSAAPAIHDEFARRLKEENAPTADVAAYPARLVL